MPDVSPTPAAAPSAPAVAAPPFTGYEDHRLVTAYVAAKLNAESGLLPSGQPRWIVHATGRIRYVPSALVATVERTHQALDPYKVCLSAEALTVNGAMGGTPRAVNVKVARVGTGAWARLCEAAAIHHVRWGEAQERERIRATAAATLWGAICADLRALAAEVPPTTQRGLVETNAGTAALTWDLTTLPGAPAYRVQVAVSQPVGSRPPGRPALTASEVAYTCGFGFAQGYGLTSAPCTLAQVRAHLAAGRAAAKAYADALTPSEDAPAAQPAADAGTVQ